MARFFLENKKLVADLTEQEIKDLEITEQSEFEIVKGKKGVYLLIEAENSQRQTPADNSLEQKITGYLEKRHPKERVEGNFEKTLTKEELEKFRQMLALGKVEKTKTSPQYVKYIYSLKKEKKQATKAQYENLEKKPEEYSLEKDGFVVTKNDAMAQKISQEMSERIKNGEIRGTRSFTGYFYIINSKLLQETMDKVIEAMKKTKTATLEEICSQTKKTQSLVRIACTFLDEEGVLLEKRKDYYQFIE